MTARATAAFAVPVLVLALGHVFSNAVRTLPAVAADVLARDLGLSAEALGALTGAFPAAFTVAMVPVGVALDRYGVRRTALVLLALGVLGCLMAAAAPGTGTMLLAQCVLGMGCSGAMMCPITYAARAVPAARFAQWVGIVQTTGNSGMLLSASPLALLVEHAGWRAGFLACAVLALVAAAAVALFVPRDAPAPEAPETPRPSAWEDARAVLRWLTAPALRPVLLLAFPSFAVVLGVRGLWGGPWLMEVKHLTRVEAGNVLFLCTLALVVGPALAGAVGRAVNRPVLLLVLGHLGAAAWIAALLAGAHLSPAYDAAVLVAFGLTITFQVFTFALVRAAVPPEQAGRALSALNISFFGGAAVLQPVSGLAAAWGGVEAALATFAVFLVICTFGFLAIRSRGPA